jgi:hypothetical protein
VLLLDRNAKTLLSYAYNGEPEVLLAIANLAKGLYLLKIETDKGTFYKKLVTQ